MHTKTSPTPVKRQHGIALVEALIAILLFSLGILALVGLQATMSKNVTQAKLRAEASFLANQLIGQMWVDQANLSSYAVANGACTTAGYAKCANWVTQVGQILPSGSAGVTVNGTLVNISMSWSMPGDGDIPGKFEISADITN